MAFDGTLSGANGSPLRDEPTVGSRRTGIHVATAVEVIINFSNAADHPAIQEGRECYNVFHDFYRHLVQALYDVGASPYVFLRQHRRRDSGTSAGSAMEDFKSGALGQRDRETAARANLIPDRIVIECAGMLGRCRVTLLH